MKIYFFLLFLLLFLHFPESSAQERKGWGGDIGLYSNSDSNLGFHYSISHHWMFNKYIGTSVGAMFFHTQLNSSGWWVDNDKTFYSLDERTIKRLNITSSLFAMYPSYKDVGLYNHVSFFFDPIPVDGISLNKTTFGTPGQESETFKKTRYSGFSPGVFAEAGIYYDLKKENNGLKLFCGFGLGWYDAYHAFNHSTIDGQKLSEHVPQNKNYYRISLRIIGL